MTTVVILFFLLAFVLIILELRGRTLLLLSILFCSNQSIDKTNPTQQRYFFRSFSSLQILFPCCWWLNRMWKTKQGDTSRPFFAAMGWCRARDCRNHLHQRSDWLSCASHLMNRPMKTFSNNEEQFNCTFWIVQFEGPEEVRSLLETISDGEDLMNEIFHADDVLFA